LYGKRGVSSSMLWPSLAWSMAVEGEGWGRSIGFTISQIIFRIRNPPKLALIPKMTCETVNSMVLPHPLCALVKRGLWTWQKRLVNMAKKRMNMAKKRMNMAKKEDEYGKKEAYS